MDNNEALQAINRIEQYALENWPNKNNLIQQSAGKIAELKANNERLREALEVTRQAISEATSPIFIAFNKTQKALSATTSQSLQAHDELKAST